MRGAHNEDALSEIVGFVLVLALVVVASTLYLLYVVPAEGREDEIEHMNQVQDRFVSYKESVDGLWMRSLADLSVPGTRGVSLSTSFDLGTGGGNTQSTGLFLSFMRPIGTAAKMRTQLDTDPTAPKSDWLGLSINNLGYFVYANGTTASRPHIPIGSLSYHTDNYYWIQQVYHYKLGGVFLEQPGEGVSVKVAPALSIYRVTNSTDPSRTSVKVSLSLTNITSPDSTVGGTGPLRVETRLRESVVAAERNKPVDNVTLQIYHPDNRWLDAWEQVLIGATKKSTLSANQDTTPAGGQWFKISRSNADHTVKLEIRNTSAGTPPVAKDVFLDLTEAPLQVTFEYDEP